MRTYTIALAILSALVLAACGTPPPPAAASMPPLPVGVAGPVARSLPVTRSFVGRIEAIETVELRPRVSGTVSEVLVANGSEVVAGQLMLRIDDAPFLAVAARAEAAVARATAHLTQASLQNDRARKLLADGLTSQQNADDATANLEGARAEVASAEADLRSTRLDLEHTRVCAPIAGRIGKVQTTAGNVVQGGGAAPATLLATIHRSDEVYAAFDLDEASWRRLAPRLRPGTGPTEAVPVAVSVPGEDGAAHHGVVAFADNQVDSASGAIRLRAKLANADRTLTPGAFARIQVEVAPPRPVLLVNERAVLSQLASRYVLVVDQAGTIAIRPVVLGAAVDGMRVVESGLAAGDRIALNNLVMLFPGRAVTPLPASMATLQNDPAPTAEPAREKAAP